MTQRSIDPPDGVLPPHYEKFLLTSLETNPFPEMCQVIVDELFTLTDATRVCLTTQGAIRRKVTTINSLPAVKRHATLVKRLERLGQLAIRHGDPIVFGEGEPLTVSDELVDALAAYLEESENASGVVWPVRDRQNRNDIVGCLILESRDSPSTLLGTLSDLEHFIALSLRNSSLVSDIFLEPSRRRLGRVIGLVSATTVRRICLIFCAISLILTTMALVRVPYVIRADGEILPVRRHRIFAPDEGKVLDVKVADGTPVQVGTPLLTIESHRLNIEELIAENEVRGKEKLIATLRAQASRAVNQGTREDAVRAQSELAREELALSAAERRLVEINAERSELNVTAPAEGDVVMFDLKRRLSNRPVSRGELLLEVMDTTGPWELKVMVPEARIGHLKRALIDPNVHIVTTFVSAGRPEAKEEAEIESFGRETLTDPDVGSYLPVVASVRSDRASERVVGEEVSVRIKGAECSLLYYCFGDVYEAIQRRWF